MASVDPKKSNSQQTQPNDKVALVSHLASENHSKVPNQDTGSVEG